MRISCELLRDAVLMLSADGRVVEANHSAGALFGAAAEELAGVACATLVDLDLNSAQAGELVRCRIERRDGTPVPVDVFMAGGGEERILVLREVDRAQLAYQARAALELAFDSTPIGLALFNTDGEYIRVNDNLCRLLGRSRDELLGRRDQELTHPADRASDLDAAWRILRGELDIWQTEKRFIRSDGSIVWVIANMSFLRDERGEPLCWMGQFQDITQRREMEERLRERERQLAEAQDVARVGSWVWEIPRDRLDWSEVSCQLFDRAAGEPPASYADLLGLIHPDDREHVRATMNAAYQRREPFSVEHRVIWDDGTEHVLLCRGKVETDEAGAPTRMLGTSQDVTDARNVERALHESEQLLSVGFDGASIGMALISTDGRWLRVNRALCELTGYSEAELLEGRFRSIRDPEELARDLRQKQRPLSGEIEGLQSDRRLVRADGTPLWAHVATSLVLDEAGEPRYFVCQVHDVGERKRHEAELQRLAEQDPLTGLLNHRVFHQRLGEEIARANRRREPLSLALLDLDHFKDVNDRHGHPAGDEVLRSAAARLAVLVREGEHLARIGGEEFAWILPGADAAGAYAAAERARLALGAAPFPVVGRLTLSAGVCELAPAADADALYADADQALYWAKQQGRDRTCRFALDASLDRRGVAGGRQDPARRLRALLEMADAADDRHPDFSEHSRRVAELTGAIAEVAGWPAERVAAIDRAARLHDVGKLTLPRRILIKRETLSAEERQLLQTHPVTGAEMVSGALTPEQVSWVRHHHERWDGTGYPDGLRGPEIPRAAQMIAVADAFDAMTHRRPYRGSLDPAAALAEIAGHAGRQFAADLVPILELTLQTLALRADPATRAA